MIINNHYNTRTRLFQNDQNGGSDKLCKVENENMFINSRSKIAIGTIYL